MATPGTLRIKLRCASWQQLATLYQRDLSRGTLFLKASQPPPLGTLMQIDLTLPSASVIELSGTIEQHVSDQRGAGVELRLAPIADSAIWMIESALASEHRRTPARGVPALAQSASASASGPVATLDDGAEVATAEADLARALLAEAEAMKQLSPFLVLGVSYDAGDAEVRKAFGELTKRYHPDRFARYESSELRQVAAEIFILIRDAYRRLCDEEARAQARAARGRLRNTGPIARAGGPPRPEGKRSPTPPAPFPALQPAAPAVPGLAAAPTVQLPASPPQRAPTAPAEAGEVQALEELIDGGRLDEALAGYLRLVKRHPQDRTLRAGIELCEGLLAMGLRDRARAAQRFEAALEIDPSNERAARELADMRRLATSERRGLLSRLMGKPEAKES
ncbi:MAG TPA: DnaJ domain-containing protein [Kofleriaceae bacterium]|nr:DnaJ domain-containing protein [Kofleriaceae bacterium]